MTKLFRQRCLFTCALAVLACGSASFGATASLRAVRINNDNVAPTSTINAQIGDTIVADIFWSDWAGDGPGDNPQLKAYQATIDGLGSYLRDNGDVMLLPMGWDMPEIVRCTGNPDCPINDPCRPSCSPNNADACVRSCVNTLACSANCPDFPVCSVFQYCVGTDHAPENFSFICTPGSHSCSGNPPPRPDFCHVGLGSITAMRVPSVDFAYGSSTLEGTGPTDTGQSCYAGTVTLIVQPDACGTIVVDFKTDISSSFVQLIGNGGQLDHEISTQPLTINLPNACPAFVPRITHTEPENCLVDSRYPHSPTNQQPAFWFNPNFEFMLHFDGVPVTNNGVFQQSDFVVTQVPGAPIPPSLSNFVPDDTTVTIRFNRPALGTRWTCVRYQPCVNAGRPVNECQACWGRLPGDVDGNLTVNASDLTALIGIVQGGSPADPSGCDMDRSGSCAAPDIIGWIDLFNGAGEFAVWAGETLQACPTQ